MYRSLFINLIYKKKSFMKKIMFVLLLNIIFLIANAAQVGFCPHNDGRCHEGVRDSGRALNTSANTFAALAKPVVDILNVSKNSSVK